MGEYKHQEFHWVETKDKFVEYMRLEYERQYRRYVEQMFKEIPPKEEGPW